MPFVHRSLAWRVVATTTAIVLLTALPAAAKPGGGKPPKGGGGTTTTAPSGYDVSYPQCGGPLPGSAAFGVVGVDGGRVLKANPCLSTEIAWARRAADPGVGYYVNTANPGPRVSSYWPSGQATPRICAAAYPENDSTDCAYDYGWNNGADSWSRTVAAASAAGAPSPATAVWWLDVETGNSWETLQYGQSAAYAANDTAALQGEADYLRAQGVTTVGVYSTTYQWGQITGGAAMPASPVWYAGVGSSATALAHCGDPASAFTGAAVALVQYAASGYDADLRCVT